MRIRFRIGLLFFGAILCAVTTTNALARPYSDLYRDGAYAEALTALEGSSEAKEAGYAYFFNRGIIRLALQEAPQALADLEKAAILRPGASELKAPLQEARQQVAQKLGASRLDATSMGFERIGEKLPLDSLFFAFTTLAILSWCGVFFVRTRRGRFARFGFSALVLAVIFGLWGYWLDSHPYLAVVESRAVKSGPGEQYLDRGGVEAGMKVRVEGTILGAQAQGTELPPTKWWKIRFNDRRDAGFIPERSGLLLVDESNTPET
jgi:hypothetical protein